MTLTSVKHAAQLRGGTVSHRIYRNADLLGSTTHATRNNSLSVFVRLLMRVFPFTEKVSFACLLACSAVVFAQAQQPALTFDQLLSRVEANSEEYRSTVPSFFCDEHVTSQEIHDGKLKQ